MSDKSIYQAFIEAYADMDNPKKNANNPAFRSKYADLEEVLSVIRPLLAASGLAITQEPVSEEGRVGVTTRVTDAQGNMLDFGTLTLPLTKNDAQGAGSAITYARRYALASIFGLAQEDDDGNAASKPQAKREAKAQPAVKTASAATLERIHSLRDQLGIDGDKYLMQLHAAAGHEVASDAELTEEQAAKLLSAYEAKAATAQIADDLGAEVVS